MLERVAYKSETRLSAMGHGEKTSGISRTDKRATKSFVDVI